MTINQNVAENIKILSDFTHSLIIGPMYSEHDSESEYSTLPPYSSQEWDEWEDD